MAFQNHTKIILLRTAKTFIVIEGSANFTANPRLENYTLSSDETLYNFHREWMEHMLGLAEKKSGMTEADKQRMKEVEG